MQHDPHRATAALQVKLILPGSMTSELAGRPPQEVLQLGRPASGEREGSDGHSEPDRVVQDDLEHPVRVARRTVRDRAQCGEVEEPRLVGQHPGKGPRRGDRSAS